MNIDTVIFDLGNVVNRWEPEKALFELYPDAEQALQAMERLEFKQWIGSVLDAGEDYEASLSQIEADNPERYELLRTYLNNIGIAHQNAVEGTAELIKALRGNGIRLLGMTNAGEPAFEALKQFALVLDLMDDIFVSAHEKLMKPDARAFHLLLDRNNLKASQCLFVDDTLVNVEGAGAVGLDAVQFVSALALEADLVARGLISESVLK